MTHKKALWLAACLMLAMPCWAQEWRYTKTISIPPPYAPVFADTTPSGDVVVTTFNNRETGDAELPVILIHKPLSDKPGFYVVCRNRFAPLRGYSGLAVDNEGCFYVCADTGEDASSWIRKFRRDGQPDTAFGTGGEIRPGRRVLGLDMSGDKLVTTFAFAQMVVIDRNTGRVVGTTGVPAERTFVRDLAVDPASQRVYAVAQAAAWVYEGGTLDNPATYGIRRLSPNAMKGPRAGEGIFFDAVTKRAVIPVGQNKALLTVGAAGDVARSEISGTTEDVRSIADAVLLADGQTMFVTDSTAAANGRCSIHVMTRVAALAAAAVPGDTLEAVTSKAGLQTGSAATPVPVAVTPGTGVAWENNVKTGLARARAENKPMLLYARSGQSAFCAELEKDFLTSAEFVAAAARFVPVYFDVATDTKLSQELGIYRVPMVGVYSPAGDRVNVLQGRFTPQQLLDELKK